MIDYTIKKATEQQLLLHLEKCDHNFIPALSTRVNLPEYANKLFEKACNFEAFDGSILIGVVAMYVDFASRKGFVSNVSVLQNYSGKGVGSTLMRNAIAYSLENQLSQIQLEVNQNNKAALALYQSLGFKPIDHKENNLIMIKNMKQERDYDKEFLDTKDHKYSYNFDFDVMHHYMLKSFQPFFKQGNFLELGSYKGDFTKKFSPYFDDITCVEASPEAVKIAKTVVEPKVKIINSLFEEAVLPEKYDNIVLTHVLEHITDPVAVLKRINDEWLSDTGRFFLVCPNANAPSRQIAVKMGLITHNSAVTPAEFEHGHQITYTLDTLERDARLAGLKVVHRSGIFFKALANFQWDRLLNTDIISKEYLEGCYQLGQQYPDLCSSIFLMCEKGK